MWTAKNQSGREGWFYFKNKERSTLTFLSGPCGLFGKHAQITTLFYQGRKWVWVLNDYLHVGILQHDLVEVRSVCTVLFSHCRGFPETCPAPPPTNLVSPSPGSSRLKSSDLCQPLTNCWLAQVRGPIITPHPFASLITLETEYNSVRGQRNI